MLCKSVLWSRLFIINRRSISFNWKKFESSRNLFEKWQASSLLVFDSNENNAERIRQKKEHNIQKKPPFVRVSLSIPIRAKACYNLPALRYRYNEFIFSDVDDVKYVINFDYPSSSEDYIHRIGRTGRSQCTGTSYAFFTPQNGRQAKDLINVLQEANQVINPKLSELAARGGGGGGGYGGRSKNPIRI